MEEPCLSFGKPIEELDVSADEREEIIKNQLKELTDVRKVLLIRNSHMGGHKYAGNCIVSSMFSLPECIFMSTSYQHSQQLYTPQGSSIWYGRVTPHEVPSIVENTIFNGLVLPPLLRGGMNISRPGCASLNDW